MINRRSLFGLGAAAAAWLVGKPSLAQARGRELEFPVGGYFPYIPRDRESVAVRVTMVSGADPRVVPMILPVETEQEMRTLYGYGKGGAGMPIDIARGELKRVAYYPAPYEHEVKTYAIVGKGWGCSIAPSPRLWKRGELVKLDLPMFVVYET
jgi:hypothetical protein